MSQEFVKLFLSRLSISDFGAFVAISSICDELGRYSGTQNDIASKTGMSRERVSSYLSKLAKYGYLEYVTERGKFTEIKSIRLV